MKETVLNKENFDSSAFRVDRYDVFTKKVIYLFQHATLPKVLECIGTGYSFLPLFTCSRAKNDIVLFYHASPSQPLQVSRTCDLHVMFWIRRCLPVWAWQSYWDYLLRSPVGLGDRIYYS